MTTTLKDKFTLNDREILMSFGLLNELCRIAGDPDGVLKMAVDHDTREEVLVAMLSERTPSGKVTARTQLEELSITVDESLALIEWAQEHCLDFFIKSMRSINDLSKRNEERLNALMSSALGSKG